MELYCLINFLVLGEERKLNVEHYQFPKTSLAISIYHLFMQDVIYVKMLLIAQLQTNVSTLKIHNVATEYQ